MTADACPKCFSRWTWTGKGWLVADIHGRASTISIVAGPPIDAPPRELSQGPNCQRRLRPTSSLAHLPAGKARVEEKRE